MGFPVKYYCILTLQEIYHLIMPKIVQDAKKWPEGKTKQDKTITTPLDITRYIW